MSPSSLPSDTGSFLGDLKSYLNFATDGIYSSLWPRAFLRLVSFRLGFLLSSHPIRITRLCISRARSSTLPPATLLVLHGWRITR